MEPKDSMHTSDLQTAATASTNAQHHITTERQNKDENTTIIEDNIAEAPTADQRHEAVVGNQQTKFEPQDSREPQDHVHTSSASDITRIQVETQPELLEQDVTGVPPHTIDMSGLGPQVLDAIPPVEVLVNPLLDASLSHIANSTEELHQMLDEPKSDGDERVKDPGPSMTLPTATPESPRGNPNEFSGSLPATDSRVDDMNHENDENEDENEDQQHQSMTSVELPAPEDDIDEHGDAASEHVSLGESPDEPVVPEHETDEHDCGGEDDGDEEWNSDFVQKMVADIARQGQFPQAQAHQSQQILQPNLHEYGQFHSPQHFGASTSPGLQGAGSLLQNHMQDLGQLQSAQYPHGVTYSVQQGVFPTSNMSNIYPSATYGRLHGSYQDPRQATQPHTQHMAPFTYHNLPMNPYGMQTHSFGSRPMLQPSESSGGHAVVARKAVQEFDDPEDDKPLSTHLSQAVQVSDQQQEQDSDSDVEFVSTKPKIGFKAPKDKTAAPKPETSRSPQPEGSAEEQESDPSLGRIDWKVPQYVAQFAPGKTKDDPPVATITIPGAIREELLLCIDHAEQEAHLFVEVFLPAQQSLATPDAQPAAAIMNFHNISVLVIEAFVAFEIGDELGKDRGHWHNDHDQGDQEYSRVHDAKDADPTEIYFAVIDRWRAGMECKSKSAELIRGIQEFNDIALELIYYINEHGLLKEVDPAEEPAKDAENAVKKHGANTVKGQSEEEEFKSKGVKRYAGKVFEPRVTKKPKTETKPKAKPKAPAKSKAQTTSDKKKKKKKGSSTVGVTVIRRGK
ncbi:cytosolic Fe-S cluster assembly factor cfd1 [Pleosporales sp. CAS-2024a]